MCFYQPTNHYFICRWLSNNIGNKNLFEIMPKIYLVDCNKHINFALAIARERMAP